MELAEGSIPAADSFPEAVRGARNRPLLSSVQAVRAVAWNDLMPKHPQLQPPPPRYAEGGSRKEVVEHSKRHAGSRMPSPNDACRRLRCSHSSPERYPIHPSPPVSGFLWLSEHVADIRCEGSRGVRSGGVPLKKRPPNRAAFNSLRGNPALLALRSLPLAIFVGHLVE